jgi:hypothetical protein
VRIAGGECCPGQRRLPRGSFSTQSGQRGSRALCTGAANQYRQSGHCRFTMPGIGSHGSALTRRAAASASAGLPLSTAASRRLVFIASFFLRSIGRSLAVAGRI